jgi:Spy/CpxP family protein refolding chaperone
MKQQLLIALLTVLVFGAGFAARVWTEDERALPPPPAALGSEFNSPSSADPKAPAKPAYDRERRAKLVAEIAELRPQIEAYRARVDALDAECEQAFAHLLNPEQRAVYDAKQEAKKKRAETQAKAPPPVPAGPLSDEEIARLRQRPFELAFWKISFAGRLDQTTKDYKLDDQQRTAFERALRQRREKFIELIDSTPSPSFKLTVLASSVERLGEPGAPAATPVK